MPKTELFGKCLEHFIALELRAYLHYRCDRRELTFWRTSGGKNEVDFILGDETAVEVKGTDMVTDRHLKSLNTLDEDITLKKKIAVSLDPAPRLMGDIQVLPYRHFLQLLWNDEI